MAQIKALWLRRQDLREARRRRSTFHVHADGTTQRRSATRAPDPWRRASRTGRASRRKRSPCDAQRHLGRQEAIYAGRLVSARSTIPNRARARRQHHPLRLRLSEPAGGRIAAMPARPLGQRQEFRLLPLDQPARASGILVSGEATRSTTSRREVPLLKNIWYFVAATYDVATGKATLHQEGVSNRYNGLLGQVAPIDYRSHVSREIPLSARSNPPDTPFLIAGAQRLARDCAAISSSQSFCGKIDRPGVFDRALSRGRA